MGRAKGQTTEVVADRFVELMGSRRGYSGDRSLAALAPSPAARHEADLLLAEITRGELASSLALLREHKKSLASPLLVELQQNVAAYLAEEMYTLWTPAAADFVDVVAGDGFADCVLLDADNNRTLHLWPAGGAYADPEDAPKSTTVCGRAVTKDYERVPRGWWLGRGFGESYERCETCCVSESSFPETAESHDSCVFPAHQEPDFRALLSTQMRERVRLLVSSRRHLSSEVARVHAADAFRTTLRAQALGRLQDGGSPLLERILGGGGVRGTPEFAAALTQLHKSDWNELAVPFQPRRWRAAGVFPPSFAAKQETRRHDFARELASTLRMVSERARHPRAFNVPGDS